GLIRADELDERGERDGQGGGERGGLAGERVVERGAQVLALQRERALALCAAVACERVERLWRAEGCEEARVRVARVALKLGLLAKPRQRERLHAGQHQESWRGVAGVLKQAVRGAGVEQVKGQLAPWLGGVEQGLGAGDLEAALTHGERGEGALLLRFEQLPRPSQRVLQRAVARVV